MCHVRVTRAGRASVTVSFHATMSDQLVQQHAALELTYVLCMSHLPYSLAKLTRTTQTTTALIFPWSSPCSPSVLFC